MADLDDMDDVTIVTSGMDIEEIRDLLATVYVELTEAKAEKARMVEELAAANAEIKRLRGVLTVRASRTRIRADSPEINVHTLAGSMNVAELRECYAAELLEVGKLTAAIKAKHPLAMGKGDGAIDTAIRLLERCGCRD